ncbi:NYN domain-containing protein [Nonomuraea glycinis]
MSVDRCALFVDAGYLLADGAMAVHGTRHRESVSWDYPGLLQLLSGLSGERTGLPLLRCYWYEATVEGRRTPEHDVLADIPGLKLRLSRIRPGRREGVDAQVHRDLMTLARNNAICDAVVVSGDEDLAQVVCDAQDLGIRVTVVHIAADASWAVSRTLRQESDDLIELGGANLRPYVTLVTGTSESSNGRRQAVSNGHGSHSLPAAPSSPPPSLPPPALPSPMQSSLPPSSSSTGGHASQHSGSHAAQHSGSQEQSQSSSTGSSSGRRKSADRGQSANPPALPTYSYPDPPAPAPVQQSAPTTSPMQQQSPTTGQFAAQAGSGTYQQPQFGAYTGPQSAPVSPPAAATAGATTLSDAVKSAHREGHDFGESVARDAPALWLEAVLARKPRMPSDLEARLLQGSSLPIDFLLHDEVRHALRRGFWDALERARH